MARYAAGRLLQAIPAFFVITMIVFALLSASPVDPAQIVLARQGDAVTAQSLRAERQELGLDLPLPVRYVHWLGGLTHLNFGTSYASNLAVADILSSHLPATIALTTTAMLITLLLSVPLGIAAACWRSVWPFDVAVRIGSVISASIPHFAMGLFAIWLFAAQLHWFPAFGGPSWPTLVLPAFALAIPTSGLLLRLTRVAMMEVLNQDFVGVARAKGLGSAAVALRHVTPNALVPILTVAGLTFADLLAGSATIEFVFAWNGIGRLTVSAVQEGDMPVVMAYVLFIATAFILLNLTVDLLYGVVDPRLRAEAAG
jgi:ABC-type dipeptide/oligopeptide/nickel transport system permease component